MKPSSLVTSLLMEPRQKTFCAFGLKPSIGRSREMHAFSEFSTELRYYHNDIFGMAKDTIKRPLPLTEEVRTA